MLNQTWTRLIQHVKVEERLTVFDFTIQTMNSMNHYRYYETIEYFSTVSRHIWINDRGIQDRGGSERSLTLDSNEVNQHKKGFKGTGTRTSTGTSTGRIQGGGGD